MNVLMNVFRQLILLCVLTLVACGVDTSSAATDEPLVIAHRGASGYLPEHTIAAKAMAYAQGADYLEQDLVMTKDDQIVVLHDHHLDTVSDVAEVYPDRHRDDGRFYVIDFTLDEIRRLSVFERFELNDGVSSPVFAGRFPHGLSTFRVHTFAEEIELIQGLNTSTGQSVGLYPEIKSPRFHHDEGKDIASAVLDTLKNYGYQRKTDKVFLQCFDPVELQRIHNELMPEREMAVRLVQLISTSEQFESLLNAKGMMRIASFADGIGPSMLLLVREDSTQTNLKLSGLVELAHDAGLLVHPYTFRREADQIPPFAKDYEDLLRIFFDEVGVDGVFTDFPDLTVRFLEARR
jgi:glycerophosphoryl diester phosphodiesterase